jgi:hypothetical protein
MPKIRSSFYKAQALESAGKAKTSAEAARASAKRARASADEKKKPLQTKTVDRILSAGKVGKALNKKR